MDDTISRAAAMDALDRLEYTPGEWATSGLTMCKDAIKALPPAQPGWIPCSERLPENIENSYWICIDTGYQCQCRWTNNVFGFGARDEWGWKFFDIPKYSKVVAWRLLPTPYREGGQYG